MQDQIIITTRPIDDAQQDIADLEHLKIKALAAPMLAIEPLTENAKPQDPVDAIVLTSRHAAKWIDASLYSKPCYCVGAATALAAQDAGFSDIITGPGDGQGLVALIRQHNHDANPDQNQNINHVFWPSAVDTGFNISDALLPHGITTDRLPVYKAATTSTWPETVDTAIRHGQVAAVLMHSGRAGEHFAKMMQKNGLQQCRQNITAIVISTRAAGLCGEGWHNIKIAASPRRSAMFAAAADVLGLPASCLDGANLDQDL